MLYLGHGLLRYILIYNLEVSFNFHLTFLQLNVIKMFTVHLTLGYFFRAPDNSNFFRFPLKVRVIGSRLYKHVVRLLITPYKGVLTFSVFLMKF